jgi:hypothetical protein
MCTINNETIKFIATIPNNSWFGIGFGLGMKDIDMMRFVSSDEVKVEDLWSKELKRPNLDTQ